MILGIAEAAQDISYPAMVQRMQAVINIVLKDPAVALGRRQHRRGRRVGHTEPGAHVHCAETREQRHATADQVIRRLSAKLAAVEGITLYMQAAQDITVGARLSKTQYQYTLTDADSERAQSLVGDFSRQAQEHAGDYRRHLRPGERRSASQRDGQPRGGVKLRHSALDRRQYARRRFRPAHRLHDLHRAQPVSRRARGRSAVPDQTRRARRHLREFFKRTAGAAERSCQQLRSPRRPSSSIIKACSRRPRSRST